MFEIDRCLIAFTKLRYWSCSCSFCVNKDFVFTAIYKVLYTDYKYAVTYTCHHLMKNGQCDLKAQQVNICHTVEHTYDACLKYSELGSFRIIAYLYGSRRWQRRSTEKKYSVFTYSKAEPHATYAIYRQTRTLCVLQYMKQDEKNKISFPNHK